MLLTYTTSNSAIIIRSKTQLIAYISASDRFWSGPETNLESLLEDFNNLTICEQKRPSLLIILSGLLG
jgi:hypothetical protein